MLLHVVLLHFLVMHLGEGPSNAAPGLKLQKFANYATGVDLVLYYVFHVFIEI